jgi:hypothetical protein
MSYLLPVFVKMFKKLRKSAIFSLFFLPMDPDPHKSLNLNPIRIRIHNPGLNVHYDLLRLVTFLKVKFSFLKTVPVPVTV